MTAIEIIALVLVVLGVVKTLIILKSPQAWYYGPFAKFWAKPSFGFATSIILGAIVLYYLLMELTIVQIVAGMTFGWLFLILVLTPYLKRLIDTLMEDRPTGMQFIGKHWFAFLLWAVLSVWVLIEIFG